MLNQLRRGSASDGANDLFGHPALPNTSTPFQLSPVFRDEIELDSSAVSVFQVVFLKDASKCLSLLLQTNYVAIRGRFTLRRTLKGIWLPIIGTSLYWDKAS
jgi:hypothetical protein